MEYIWNPTDWLQTEAANADSLFISIKIIDKGISPQNVQSWGKNWPKVIFREVQDTVPFLAALVQVKHFSREQILSFEASRWKEVSVTNVSYAVTFLFFIIFFLLILFPHMKVSYRVIFIMKDEFIYLLWSNLCTRFKI